MGPTLRLNVGREIRDVVRVLLVPRARRRHVQVRQMPKPSRGGRGVRYRQRLTVAVVEVVHIGRVEPGQRPEGQDWVQGLSVGVGLTHGVRPGPHQQGLHRLSFQVKRIPTGPHRLHQPFVEDGDDDGDSDDAGGDDGGEVASPGQGPHRVRAHGDGEVNVEQLSFLALSSDVHHGADKPHQTCTV